MSRGSASESARDAIVPTGAWTTIGTHGLSEPHKPSGTRAPPSLALSRTLGSARLAQPISARSNELCATICSGVRLSSSAASSSRLESLATIKARSVDQ